MDLRAELDLVKTFRPFDHARLMRMSQSERADQLAARTALCEYVDRLWEDIERAGERPAVGEKYQAVTDMRELIQALRLAAFEAVYAQE